MDNIQVDINDVVADLSEQITQLTVQLAVARATIKTLLREEETTDDDS